MDPVEPVEPVEPIDPVGPYNAVFILAIWINVSFGIVLILELLFCVNSIVNVSFGCNNMLNANETVLLLVVDKLFIELIYVPLKSQLPITFNSTVLLEALGFNVICPVICNNESSTLVFLKVLLDNKSNSISPLL